MAVIREMIERNHINLQKINKQQAPAWRCTVTERGFKHITDWCPQRGKDEKVQILNNNNNSNK